MAAPAAAAAPPTIAALWQGVVAALDVLAHGGDRDARTVTDTLQPPASEHLLAAAQASSFGWPPDLVELLRQANGQAYSEEAGEWPGAPWTRLLPAGEILSYIAQLPAICETLEQEWGLELVDDYVVPASFWRDAGEGAPAPPPGVPQLPKLALNDRWLPFAECGSGGGGPPFLLLLDCAPGDGAPVGRVLGFGGEGDTLSVWALSLRELLGDVARVVQTRAGHVAAAAAAPGAPGAVGGGGAQRHRRVLWDDGPRVWHAYAGGVGLP